MYLHLSLIHIYSDLEPVMEVYDKYLKAESDMEDAKELLKNETDHEMKVMLEEESQHSKISMENLEEEVF